VARVPDTDQVALLDAVERQGGDERGADAGAVLGGQDDHLVLLVGGPVEDLAQGLRAARLEVRVLGEDGAVRADVAPLDVLLLADGRDAAGGEARGAGADQLGQAAAQLELGLGGPDAELALEQLPRLLQVLERVLLDGGEEGGVERVGLAQLGRVLALEDEAGLVVDQVDQDQAEDLAQVETGGHLLKGLLAGAGGVAVDDDVVLGARQDDVLVVEGAVLAVDGDGHVRGQAHVGDLGDGADVLHVRGVDAGAEDAADLDLGVRVRGGDERSGGVVDQRGDLDGQALQDIGSAHDSHIRVGEGRNMLICTGSGVPLTHPLLQDLLEEGHDVLALDAVNVEALGPALQDAVVDVVLGGRVGEGEAEGQGAQLLAVVVLLDELLQAVGQVLPQLLGGAGLELLGHAVLGLGDVEAALLLGQDDLADAQVGAAHVEGEEGPLLVAGGEAHDPGDVHRLEHVSALLSLSLSLHLSAREAHDVGALDAETWNGRCQYMARAHPAPRGVEACSGTHPSPAP